ncbi:Histidine-containing phosphotransfer protein 4 [Acorus gramineus]|uniref:Histidine-containing phosphotransfer protein n=1 Tax=Acorus gramineus TaxID=55184 RepID=A0AAV9AQB7_ACOGR|nr:Histidine-containing phosphotransfer protein 4 [Acorus gramineus]
MDNMQRQVANVRQDLFKQGYLDDQFLQLELLQDDVTPNFVEEVVASFFRDSPRLLSTIEHALQKSPLDFDRLDRFMHQFKGSSSSIGALRLKSESSLFSEYCDECNVEGCFIKLDLLKLLLASSDANEDDEDHKNKRQTNNIHIIWSCIESSDVNALSDRIHGSWTIRVVEHH